MNLILIVVDTFGAHYLGCYGNREIQTPSVDGLASRSVLFEQAFGDALPTIPARRAIYTGRQVFPSRRVPQADEGTWIWRGWHQLYAEDVTLAETLGGAGYTTALVSDLYHQFKPGKNFHRGFQSFRFLRGQEADRVSTGPVAGISAAEPAEAYYIARRQLWKTPDDWPAARTFSDAAAWLEEAGREATPFYLHIESFSPHEFWDPPEDYYRLYMRGNYSGPRIIMPPQWVDQLTADEFEHVRALYCGFITFVDTLVGRFLNRVAELGLADDTIVALTADHGTMLGQQGNIGKGEGSLRTQITRVPMMILDPRRPEWAGQRIGGFVQHPDLMPTLLDLLGVAAPLRITGRSLRELMEKNQPSTVPFIVSGWNDHASIRTRDWMCLTRWNPGEGYEELYNVTTDPEELVNVLESYPDVREQLRAQVVDYVAQSWSITDGAFIRTADR